MKMKVVLFLLLTFGLFDFWLHFILSDWKYIWWLIGCLIFCQFLSTIGVLIVMEGGEVAQIMEDMQHEAN